MLPSISFQPAPLQLLHHNFPHYPSRLSAIFAFGDFETCKKVSLKHKWDLSSVKRFKLLPNNLNKVAKVNMEIVSLDRYATKVSMSDSVTISQIWHSYWTGLGNIQLELPTVDGRKIFNSDVIWEVYASIPLRKVSACISPLSMRASDNSHSPVISTSAMCISLTTE